MSTRLSPTVAILGGLLFCAIGTQLWAALSWGYQSYQMTEWLINYAGGFVRRGLPGVLIGWVSDISGVQANYLVILISLVCYLSLTLWLLRRATRVFPAALILSCIVMGFPAYQDSIIRKDCLGLLLLLGCLQVDASKLPRILTMILVNLLAGLAILSHESFVFYAIPAFILLGKRDHQPHSLPTVLRRSLILLPAAGVFLLTVVHHGTPEIAQQVHESWMPLWQSIDAGNVPIEGPAASIKALGWTTSQGLSLSLYMFSTGFYQPTAWLMVYAISFGLIVLFTGHFRSTTLSSSLEAKTRIISLLLFQLLFISPLFILGVDYGRWLFFWVVSSMMLLTMNRQAPDWLESFVACQLNRPLMRRQFEQIPIKEWYLLLFGVPVCWNLHAFIVASPLMRHLEIIRHWI